MLTTLPVSLVRFVDIFCEHAHKIAFTRKLFLLKIQNIVWLPGSAQICWSS